MQALTTNHEIIAEQLMLRFPIPSSYVNSSCELSVIEGSTTETSLESILAPSQILSPNHIIKSLISSYPNMTMTYLKHLCSSLPNCVSPLVFCKMTGHENFSEKNLRMHNRCTALYFYRI